MYAVPGLGLKPLSPVRRGFRPVAAAACRHQVFGHRQPAPGARQHVVEGVRLLRAVCALMVPLGEDPATESGFGDAFGLELGLVDLVIEWHQ